MRRAATQTAAPDATATREAQLIATRIIATLTSLPDDTATAVTTPAATPTPAPTATSPVRNTWTNPLDNAVYVYILPGEFIMGHADAGADAPPHEVYVDGFWIKQTEVTNAEYGLCVMAGACTTPHDDRWLDPALADHPVTYVNWEQATAYATWAGGRLPTEAEWEKAARGDDERRYPWGNTFRGEWANHCDATCPYAWSNPNTADEYAATSPVGAYVAGASPYGVLDMAGNVWEWVADWYSEDYYQQSPPENPNGPPDGRGKVLRGGSFITRADGLQSTTRYRNRVRFRNDVVGFRIVLER